MNRLHRWYCRSSPWKKKLETEILPWALKDVELEDDVLEIGPGPGLTTDWLRDRCSRLSCLEVDQDLASSLKERMAHSDIHVECGDATAMPYGDGSFLPLCYSPCYTTCLRPPSRTGFSPKLTEYCGRAGLSQG